MKLSFKIFFAAFTVVILSAGLLGVLLPLQVTTQLWDAQNVRADLSARFAAESLNAYADVAYGEFTANRLSALSRQILGKLDSDTVGVAVIPIERAEKGARQLKAGESRLFFEESNGLLLRRSQCRLHFSTGDYLLTASSDFTAVSAMCDRYWLGYSLVILLISLISGVVLLAVGRHIARPLVSLTEAANELAAGNHGKTVDIRTSDREIRELVRSFNTMSAEVNRRIRQITTEAEKRSAFVAGFSHECKTPLTAITGYAQMLSTYDLRPEEQKTAVTTIAAEAKRLDRLARQMLDLHLLGQDDIIPEPVALQELAQAVTDTCSLPASRQGIALTVEFPAGKVKADRVLIQSLLYNLADNACKASEPGDTVRITARDGEERIVFTVEDEGCGIAPEHIPLLTEPFYREDKSRSRRLGGTGLGLALCNEIAHSHGTELVFRSEPGIGTAVSFSLEKEGMPDENKP